MALEHAGVSRVSLSFSDEAGAGHTVELYAGGGVISTSDGSADKLGLELKRVCEGARDEWRLFATPAESVRLTSLRASLRLDMEASTPLFLNGYESWTDSCERPAGQTMAGLNHVPRAVVSKWVLDGSGDYRFTRYDGRRGRQHGWGYGYVRHGNAVSMVASLNEDTGFTLLRSDAAAKSLSLEKELPQEALAAGVCREVFSFGLYEGALEDCVDAWFEAAGIRCLPARPLVGFTSWYRHYGDISEEKILADLDAVEAELSADELGERALPLFQIDDGFAPVGDWLLPHPSRFPHGMKPLAEEIAARGLVPGLWLAPFVCEEGSKVYTEHADWLLRDASGAVVKTGCNWPGASALDVQNPQVRAYIANFLRVVTAEWGFKLLKLDFLFAACMVPHADKNRGELMADALELIRQSIAPGTTTILCGVPMVSSFGRTEYCRVGCDVSLDWDDKLYMRPLHRERVSTKRSLANSRGRAHLDGRAFRCDPDVLLLRRDVKLTPEQRTQLIEADEKLGGVLLTSDDMAAWDEDQRQTWRAAVKNFLAKEA